MPTLSIIIIAKDVADEIVPTLKTCRFADEVILVDTGSTDNTIKVSRPFIDKLVQVSYSMNFARWRNEGAKATKGDWILYIDSDERINKRLQREILSIINRGEHDSYTIPRYEVFMGKHLDHWPHPRVHRLFKKESLIRWRGKLHEQPQVKGTVGQVRHQLIHLSHKNIDEKVLNTLDWSHLEAENLVKAKHPPMKGWRFFRVILTEFWNRFVKQGLWKDGTEGSIEVIYQMFSVFLTYVRFWEKQRKPSLKQTYDQIDQDVLKELKQ